MVHAVKAHGGVEVLPHASLTWCWMEVNGHHCAPAALLQGTESQYTLSRSLCGPVDPMAGLNCLLALPGIMSLCISYQVYSLELSWLPAVRTFIVYCNREGVICV